MHATIRRYDGVDQNRSAELTRKVNESLVPKLEKQPGFMGYFLVEADHGVFSSLGLFETPEQGKESSKFVATWIRDEKLDTILPNEPKITSGQRRRYQRPRLGRRLARRRYFDGEGLACRALSVLHWRNVRCSGRHQSESEACTERGRLPTLLDVST